MRHLYKVVILLSVLLLVVGIHRKSSKLDESNWVDIPVSAATNSNTAEITPDTTLTAARPTNALAAGPSNSAWAGAIDTILRDNLEPEQKAQRMLQLLPHLPSSLQPEAAQHLVNFATDTAPQPVLEPLLNTATDASAQSVLLVGLLQRSDKIRLPALLAVARNAQHPKNTQAVEYLKFLLEADHGQDWSKWQEAIDHR